MAQDERDEGLIKMLLDSSHMEPKGINVFCWRSGLCIDPNQLTKNSLKPQKTSSKAQ